MFTMSHKAVVLNSMPDGGKVVDIAAGAVGVAATEIIIPGFCNFPAGTLTGKITVSAISAVGVPAAVDFTAIVPDGMTIGDTVQVEIKFTQNRYVSEYSSDFIKQGDTIIFQSTPAVSAPSAALVGELIEAGWVAYNNAFNIAQTPPLTVTAVNAVVTVTMAEDFLNIESMTIKLVPAGAKLAPAFETELAGTGTFTGVEAIGAGKFLEESIRTASYTNMDPYANKPHGSDSVDIRGTYHLVEFEAAPNAGWGYHDTLGTAIADQDVAVKPQKFTMYLNEAYAWDLTNG